MILIADSGSTKTDWKLISGNKQVAEYRTVGLNPFFHTRESLIGSLNEADFKDLDKSKVDEVFFYGAGSSSEAFKKLMNSGFSAVFTKAKIHIEHDLLGAARALFGNKKGIALILGTGSNSCLYDGENIIRIKGGYGYILGDEGSGMHIGRKLIKHFMNDSLPPELRIKFMQEFNLNKEQIIHKTYKEPNPNRFLASFSYFIGQNIENPFCEQIVRSSFRKFLKLTLFKFDNSSVHNVRVVGSVGYNFKQILLEEARVEGYTIDSFITKPVDELVKYHIGSRNL